MRGQGLMERRPGRGPIIPDGVNTGLMAPKYAFDDIVRPLPDGLDVV